VETTEGSLRTNERGAGDDQRVSERSSGERSEPRDRSDPRVEGVAEGASGELETNGGSLRTGER
ncbi:MAG: hypothetical protein ABEJ71_04505, partial [Halodesulfurarchaeum sp.]